MCLLEKRQLQARGPSPQPTDYEIRSNPHDRQADEKSVLPRRARRGARGTLHHEQRPNIRQRASTFGPKSRLSREIGKFDVLAALRLTLFYRWIIQLQGSGVVVGLTRHPGAIQDSTLASNNDTVGSEMRPEPYSIQSIISTASATASPPPMHRLAMPRRPPVRLNAFKSVTRIRAPLAPIGCPAPRHRRGC